MSCSNTDIILKKTLGQILVWQLNELKIRKAACEVIDDFDYEIVLDYLEMSGIPWLSRDSHKPLSRLPTIFEMKKFLEPEFNQVLNDRVIVEKHLQNNFTILYDGNHITLIYSIVKVTRGCEMTKAQTRG